MELNIEQRYWFAWLYGNTYNLATAWIIANEFPDYENVNLTNLSAWNTANYKRLRYQTDNKWQKGHLPTMFASYKRAMGTSSQQECFNELLTDNPAESFNNVYNFVVNNFFKFGRYLTWFYLQFLAETCDLPIEPDSLMLQEDASRSHCHGLLYALNLQDWVDVKKFKLTKTQYAELETQAVELLKECKAEFKDCVTPTFFNMETTLCAFKKIFRERDGRYLGYYLDRQAEDIVKCENDNWYGIDWSLLWVGRNENIEPYLLHKQVDKTKFGELIRNNKIQYL